MVALIKTIIGKFPRFKGKRVCGELPDIIPDNHGDNIALEILDIVSAVDVMRRTLMAVLEDGHTTGAIEPFLIALKKTEVEVIDLYNKVVRKGLAPQQQLFPAMLKTKIKCKPEKFRYWRNNINKRREALAA